MLIFFSFYTNVYSQKVIEKSWDANSFEKIEINTDEVFKIEIISQKTSEIRLMTLIEGENYESLNIGASEKGETLYLQPTYRPYFKAKNDKLAAHKVISIEMKLIIPETKEIYVNAKIASLQTTGAIQKLNVNLRDGRCFMNNYIGNANINTREGDITVFTLKNVSGTGFSKKGKVKNKLSNNGIYFVKAESVNGNISLLKTQE